MESIELLDWKIEYPDLSLTTFSSQENSMTKRSVFMTLAAGLLASVAFATPSHAGTQLVTTTATFTVTSPGTASDIEVTYTPGVDPITDLKVVSSTGVTITGISETADVVTVTFNPSAAGTIVWSFDTGTAGTIGFSTASLTGVTTGTIGTLGVGVVSGGGSTPEPTSVALLGIGVTGFLAFRRLFKRSSVA
jgi:PEP-CTERM motif